MMYEAPIDIIYKDIQYQMEEGVYKAIQNVGIEVDREELLKALKYDRGQYNKGFEDGKKAKIPLLYHKASCLECYSVVDVSLDELLLMGEKSQGVIISLNDDYGREDDYKKQLEDDPEMEWWYTDLLENNDEETLYHIFNDKYLLTQYDDWME